MRVLGYLRCLARLRHAWTPWSEWERRDDDSRWSMRRCDRCRRCRYRSDRYAGNAVITPPDDGG